MSTLLFNTAKKKKQKNEKQPKWPMIGVQNIHVLEYHAVNKSNLDIYQQGKCIKLEFKLRSRTTMSYRIIIEFYLTQL